MRATAITELLTLLGCDKIRERPRVVNATCPLAQGRHEGGADRHPSFGVMVNDTDRSGWLCYACGSHGTLGWLVTQWALQDRTRLVEAPLRLIEREEEGAEAVHRRIDTKIEARWAEVEPQQPVPDLEVFSEAEIAPFLGKVPQYALDRGLSLETCKAWQLGYDKGIGSRPIPRLVFPVRRQDGALVGMIGRAIEDFHEPKYLNYWNFQKSHHLYGLHRVASRDRLVLVEGLIDVLRWAGYDLPAAGLIGAHASEEQVQLALCFERIYLALDRDEAGRLGEEQLIRRLHGRVPVFQMTFPKDKHDPKELTREEAWTAVEQARRVLTP